MMAHSFTGRCALYTRTLILRALILLMLVGLSPQVLAASADDFDVQIREALAAADAAWTRSLLLPEPENAAYDEQVFTELSPILDSPEGVKLPDDQRLPE